MQRELHDKPFQGMSQAGFVYKSVRIGVVEDVNRNSKRITIRWLDGLGGRDNVQIAQPFVYSGGSWHGVISLPSKGSVALLGLDSQGNAYVLGFLPLNYEILPPLEDGEIILQSKGKGQISLKGDGSVSIKKLDDESNPLYEIYADPDGNITIKGKKVSLNSEEINLAGGEKGVARVDDEVEVELSFGISVDENTHTGFINQVVKGKITKGSTKIKGG